MTVVSESRSYSWPSQALQDGKSKAPALDRPRAHLSFITSSWQLRVSDQGHLWQKCESFLARPHSEKDPLCTLSVGCHSTDLLCDSAHLRRLSATEAALRLPLPNVEASCSERGALPSEGYGKAQSGLSCQPTPAVFACGLAAWRYRS